MTKYYVMLTELAFESIAEDYCSEFESWQLKTLMDKGVSSEILRDWLESEYPEEQFDEGDICDFNSCIINHAEWLIEEAKQEAAYELTSSIDNIISDHCGCLEDDEIASIFIEYASRYLPNKFN